MESSVMLGSIPFFVYTTALRRFFCDGDAPRHWRMPMWGGFLGGAMVMAIRRRRQPPNGGCIIIAPGWLAYLGSVEE